MGFARALGSYEWKDMVRMGLTCIYLLFVCVWTLSSLALATKVYLGSTPWKPQFLIIEMIIWSLFY